MASEKSSPAPRFSETERAHLRRLLSDPEVQARIREIKARIARGEEPE